MDMGADMTAPSATVPTTEPTDAEPVTTSLTRRDAFVGLLDRHGPLIGSWLGGGDIPAGTVMNDMLTLERAVVPKAGERP